MYGWLIVNGYFKSDKFEELFSFLLTAAEKKGITLEKIENCSVLADVLTGEIIAPETPRPDFVLFWDKDIRLAQTLEACGLRLFNPAEAIRLCDDKSLTCLALAKAGIRQPRSFIAPFAFARSPRNNSKFFRECAKTLGYPMVIKECRGSFGTGVHLVNNDEETSLLVQELGSAPCIVQEYIKESFGRDIRVSVVGGKAVAAMLRQGRDGDFRSNLTLGGHFAQIEPTNEQLSIAVDAAMALGLDFAGVDVLFGKDDEPIICEVNSNAHFKTTFDCTGVNMAELIIDHIISEVGR